LVVLEMIGLERRLAPRAKWLTDIIFEPNNGGIVLNVSEGGLCFHSIAPLEKNSTMRFSLSLHNRRIPVAGELAWLDETEKTGGLRFTVLPAEIHEEIRNWTCRSAAPVAYDETPSLPFPPLRVFPVMSAIASAAQAAHDQPAPLAAVSPESKRPKPWFGFSGGLTIGLLVSALVTTTFLFHTYRREFGESIIQFGERVAARPQAQVQATAAAAAVAPIAEAASPMPQTALPASPPGAPIQPLQPPDTPVPKTRAEPEKSQEATLKPARTTLAAFTAAGGPGPKAPRIAGAAPIGATLPTITASAITFASESYLIPSQPGPAPPLTPTSSPSVHIEASEKPNVDATPEMYFEIGRFKERLTANGPTDKLGQLGFRATVIQKSHLWTNFYYVLVGPYADNREARAAHKSLIARGFKPRAFERGSRDFTLTRGLTLNGTSMPVGDCTIKWESYSSDVAVQFVQDHSAVATVDGKWVKRDVRYRVGAIAYTTNRDGSRNLLEIRFAGMSRALVF
jgi:PilZ domain/SPOR domain